MSKLTPEEMHEQFLALPDGSSAGCRERDDPWVDRFGQLDFPDDISKPVDALPAGYECYLAVMHQLEDDAGPRQWVDDQSNDPWGQVDAIVEHGLDGRRFAADVEIGRPQSHALAVQLGLLTSTSLFTCGFFGAAYRACTVTGPALTRALDGEEYRPPRLWFPHDLAWVANAPYDAGWTYLACDAGYDANPPSKSFLAPSARTRTTRSPEPTVRCA